MMMHAHASSAYQCWRLSPVFITVRLTRAADNAPLGTPPGETHQNSNAGACAKPGSSGQIQSNRARTDTPAGVGSASAA
jgi:hypothetical protein